MPVKIYILASAQVYPVDETFLGGHHLWNDGLPATCSKELAILLLMPVKIYTLALAQAYPVDETFLGDHHL